MKRRPGLSEDVVAREDGDMHAALSILFTPELCTDTGVARARIVEALIHMQHAAPAAFHHSNVCSIFRGAGYRPYAPERR